MVAAMAEAEEAVKVAAVKVVAEAEMAVAVVVAVEAMRVTTVSVMVMTSGFSKRRGVLVTHASRPRTAEAERHPPETSVGLYQPLSFQGTCKKQQ